MKAYLKQYVDRPNGEPARLAAGHRSQACRSGISAVAAEPFMDNVGYRLSNTNVTGPSFTDSTFMWAAKTPVSTGIPCARK